MTDKVNCESRYIEENEPYKAEYYDDSGNLIYSDQGTDDDYGINSPVGSNVNTNQLIGTVMNLLTNALTNNSTGGTPDVDNDDDTIDEDEVDDNHDY